MTIKWCIQAKIYNGLNAVVSCVCELILLYSVLCCLAGAVHKFDFCLLTNWKPNTWWPGKVTDVVIKELFLAKSRCFVCKVSPENKDITYTVNVQYIFIRTTWKEFNENTQLHLQQAVGKMWIFHYSLQVYEVPDERNGPKEWENWLYITLGVAAIFTLLLVGLWHFDVFNTSNK
jgi:hypothetical protein